MLNIIGPGREEVQIGEEVEITFEPRGEAGFQIPQARRITA